jgi:hypothetical protein
MGANSMKVIIKCVVCNGKSQKGIHDICWKEFKGWMLSDRHSFGIGSRGMWDDMYMSTGQNYVDKQGRNIVQGRVMPITHDGDDINSILC